MSPDILLRPSRAADLLASEALLRRAKLPLEGLQEHFPDAIVASHGAEIVGLVALELYERHAVLRSLVVAERIRGIGLGARLTREALQLARARGASDVYLLTETAREFFPKFGFRVEDRSTAPRAIQNSIEFRVVCPTSATMMHARIEA